MTKIKNPERMLEIAVISVHDAAAAHNYVRHLVQKHSKTGPMYIYLSRDQIDGARPYGEVARELRVKQEKERNV